MCTVAGSLWLSDHCLEIKTNHFDSQLILDLLSPVSGRGDFGVLGKPWKSGQAVSVYSRTEERPTALGYHSEILRFSPSTFNYQVFDFSAYLPSFFNMSCRDNSSKIVYS